MIEFDAEKHQYTLDGKPLISVTQLMRKHGLAPDYSGVSEEVLKRAADRGTLIHKEIEEYNKTGAIGFTAEAAAFADYIRKNDLCVEASEMRVYNDICAGTVDLVIGNREGVQIIADIKTTATLNVEAVSWQLSIYNYLMNNPNDFAQAFHFDSDGNLKVIQIPFKPWEEVDRLMKCERDGVLYRQDVSDLITSQQVAAIQEAERIIAEAEKAKKEAEARIADVKNALMAEMEKRALKTFETDRIKITYVLPSTRTTIDSARLKKEMPEIAEKFSKTTETSASVRITLKGE